QLWDIAGGKEVRRFEGHTEGIGAVALSPDGRFAATVGDVLGEDKTVRIWDARTGQQIEKFAAGDEPVWSVAVSPGSRLVGYGGGRATGIHIWDLAARREMTRLETPKAAARHLAFSGDGRMLATSGGEGVVTWELASRRKEKTELLSGGPLAFLPDGRRLLAA